MKQTLLLIALIFAFTTQAQMRKISYNDKSQQLDGVYAAPEKPLPGNPGVLILPAWMGITQHEKDVAGELSALGYRVFIADIYGLGNYPADRKEAAAQSGKFKQDPQLYQKRIKLALDQLFGQGADPGKLVVIGYCFGGTGALEAARANLVGVKGVVSFHGGLSRDASRKISHIKPKVLVLHGADDPFVKPDEIQAFQQEMRDSKADWQFVSYGNAVHAFTEKQAGTDNSKGAAYNAEADKRSKQALLAFLEEIFSS